MMRVGPGAFRPAVLARIGLALVAASLLAACSADPGRDPETFGIPTATAAPIRMDVCKPGTFIGTMTINCPQTVR